jgi:hypothetical protein
MNNVKPLQGCILLIWRQNMGHEGEIIVRFKFHEMQYIKKKT